MRKNYIKIRKTNKLLSIVLILLLSLVVTGCGIETAFTDISEPEKKTVVGFVPLDIRPCCFDIPLEIAEIAGAEVLTPEMEKLTFFKDQPDTDYVRSWLKENAPCCTDIVISMEQLAYGGLIQSRYDNRGTDSEEKAVQLIRDIKKENPDVNIYLSSVIMRTYTSTFSNEDEIWRSKINEYCKAYYESEILRQESSRKELESLKAEIPANILDTFLGMREVNHQLNLTCIDLVNEGTVNKLFICQEDCGEGGIQSIEQAEILEKIDTMNLEDKISLANGTDEAGAELLMHAIDPEGCSTSVLWLGDNTEFVANYEDRKFKENLNEHSSFLNINLDENSENVLCILVPKKLQGDYSNSNFSNHEAYTSEELSDMCCKIKDLSDDGKHCYILDLDCANGGCIDFLRCLGKTMDIKDIYGYSGWNTASNSLGTLLAQIIATGNGNSAQNQTYTAERILDEAVYQSVIRPIMYERANKTGINVYDLENPEETEKELCLEFETQEELIREILGDDIPEYKTSLRWPRLFEISVKATTK